jgi:alkylhydroperoxidase/carboxymuconolactone decarboxylase family protein YurZ
MLTTNGIKLKETGRNAAVASGVTIDEITEALVQITVYCGTPAGRQAFLAAHEAGLNYTSTHAD